MIVHGYTLVLYCDVCNEFEPHPHLREEGEFVGESRAECSHAARKARWTIDWKTMTCKCPKHYHVTWHDKREWREARKVKEAA